MNALGMILQYHRDFPDEIERCLSFLFFDKEINEKFKAAFLRNCNRDIMESMLADDFIENLAKNDNDALICILDNPSLTDKHSHKIFHILRKLKKSKSLEAGYMTLACSIMSNRIKEITDQKILADLCKYQELAFSVLDSKHVRIEEKKKVLRRSTELYRQKKLSSDAFIGIITLADSWIEPDLFFSLVNDPQVQKTILNCHRHFNLSLLTALYTRQGKEIADGIIRSRQADSVLLQKVFNDLDSVKKPHLDYAKFSSQFLENRNTPSSILLALWIAGVRTEEILKHPGCNKDLAVSILAKKYQENSYIDPGMFSHHIGEQEFKAIMRNLEATGFLS